MLVWVSSSAFFSNDITHTFLFCLHLVAAALFRSRNFRRRSSGSSSTTRLRRPPLGGGDCSVCVGCICWVAGDIWNTGLGRERVSASLSSLISVCHHPTRRVIALTHQVNSQPPVCFRTLPSKPQYKHLYITSCSYSRSGNFPKNNIWLCHVPCEPGCGCLEWQSGWLTGLIHQPAHLVKKVSGGSFPPPTSTQTNTTRRSQKTRF